MAVRTTSQIPGSYAAVFAPVETTARTGEVVRRLEDSIALGLLPDGSPLPAEQDLAERFGVATTTVREALAVLRDGGLIRTKRGRGGGSFVCGPDDGGRASLIERLRGVSLAELRDQADHYAAIAGACAALAADRADELDITRLRAVADRASEEGGVHRHEAQFHLDLAASAQSARLTREEIALQGELGPLFWLSHELCGSAAHARQEHADIVARIARRDAQGAREASQRHVASLFAAVRRAHGQASRGDVA